MGTEANMSDDEFPSARGPDATFLGWQRTSSGNVFALYTVTAANHPSRGSTVSERGLRKLDLQVPETPLRDGVAMYRHHDGGNERSK
jgi:hypothetical protein